MFKVEKDVEFPPRQSEYPFAEMEAGDSFLIEAATKEEAQKLAAKARAAGKRYCESTEGLKIATRVVEGGVRVWIITAEEEEAAVEETPTPAPKPTAKRATAKKGEVKDE